MMLIAAAGLTVLLAAADAAPVEAKALNGEPLLRPELPADIAEEFEAKLAIARRDFRADHSADHTIWLGRRLAYLGRYREAIDVYTDGIHRFSDDPRLYRHRGHRYITVRNFDAAIADLNQAAALASAMPDRIEPDGLPNALKIPTSTLKTNIYYHLGLAHFLKGEYDSALAAYELCLEASTNRDVEAATRYWLYLTQLRLNKADAAAATLAAVDSDWTLIENEGYFDLLRLYQGELTAAQLLPDEVAPSLAATTTLYGLAQYHRREGNDREYQRLIDQILAADGWAAFGYIAAEADRYSDR